MAKQNQALTSEEQIADLQNKLSEANESNAALASELEAKRKAEKVSLDDLLKKYQYTVEGLQKPGIVLFRQVEYPLHNLDQKKLAQLYQDGCRDYIKQTEK